MADKPVTREEKYLAYLTGDYKGEIPKPITRKEKYLYELCLKGMGGEISPEEIKNAVNEYLEKNPVKPGATTEQALQIEQNKTDIGSLKEDLSNKITKFYASSHGETHLADSDNGKIMDMKVFGNSEQKKYTGYQLFALAPIDLSTGEKVSLPYTENGITVDIANDGIGYTVRGTNTLNEKVSDIYLSMSNAFDIEAGTYTRRGKIINGNSNVELISGGGSSNGGCLEYRADKVDFTFTETVKKGKSGNFVIRISPGATVNAIVYFQIEKGSEAHDFEPYVGGQPSPSPDYPQEIKSVVNPTVRVFGGTFGNKLNNKQINWLIENMNIWHDNIHFVLYDEFGINGSIRLVVCVYKNDINNYPCTFIDTDGNITTGRYQIDSINNDVKNKFIHCNMLPIADTRNVLTVVDSDSNKTVGLPNNYQTVTLPYTLNAIPVSSGGNVTIDGQQYIADYVDVERGKLVKMVDSSKLDNTQSIVNKTEWLLAEPQEIDLTQEEAQTLKALATYYPTTNISINSEQLDGYTVFNYPISMANGWNYVKQQLNDNRDYIYDMDAKTQDIDTQSAEAYVNSEYAVALTELEV